MPSETNRVQTRKQVVPGVWVPVIDQITFSDNVDRGQETTWAYDNSNQNQSRKVHVVTVGSGNGSVEVERIDKYSCLDPVERGQETQSALNNSTEPIPPQTDQLPGRKVQFVRYYANNDQTSSSWVDVEQIVQLNVLDPVDRGQETQYATTAFPPANDPIDDGDPYMPTFATCDMSLPIADYTESGTIDPPWRIDPWQNIVNVSTFERYFIVYLNMIASGAFCFGEPISCESPTIIDNPTIDYEDRSTDEVDVAYSSAVIYTNTSFPTANSWTAIKTRTKSNPASIFNDTYLTGQFPAVPPSPDYPPDFTSGFFNTNEIGLQQISFADWTIPVLIADGFGFDVIWAYESPSPADEVLDSEGHPILGIDVTDEGHIKQLPFVSALHATLDLYTFIFTSGPSCIQIVIDGVPQGTAQQATTNAPLDLSNTELYEGGNVVNAQTLNFSTLSITFNGVQYIPVGVQVNRDVEGNVGGHFLGILFKAHGA